MHVIIQPAYAGGMPIPDRVLGLFTGAFFKSSRIAYAVMAGCSLRFAGGRRSKIDDKNDSMLFFNVQIADDEDDGAASRRFFSHTGKNGLVGLARFLAKCERIRRFRVDLPQNSVHSNKISN